VIFSQTCRWIRARSPPDFPQCLSCFSWSGESSGHINTIDPGPFLAPTLDPDSSPSPLRFPSVPINPLQVFFLDGSRFFPVLPHSTSFDHTEANVHPHPPPSFSCPLQRRNPLHLPTLTLRGFSVSSSLTAYRSLNIRTVVVYSSFHPTFTSRPLETVTPLTVYRATTGCPRYKQYELKSRPQHHTSFVL